MVEWQLHVNGDDDSFTAVQLQSNDHVFFSIFIDYLVDISFDFMFSGRSFSIDLQWYEQVYLIPLSNLLCIPMPNGTDFQGKFPIFKSVCAKRFIPLHISCPKKYKRTHKHTHAYCIDLSAKTAATTHLYVSLLSSILISFEFIL